MRDFVKGSGQVHNLLVSPIRFVQYNPSMLPFVLFVLVFFPDVCTCQHTWCFVSFYNMSFFFYLSFSLKCYESKGVCFCMLETCVGCCFPLMCKICFKCVPHVIYPCLPLGFADHCMFPDLTGCYSIWLYCTLVFF